MIDPKEDGVTHINIYSKGNTALGRFLSNFADCHVKTEDGYFRTIEGYWYWLSTKHEPLRDFVGWQCKQVGKGLQPEDYPEIPNFKEKILKAIAAKILSDQFMLEQLKESTLPLKHYYLYGDKVVEPTEGKWIIEFIEYLRATL